jgi:hypothetical protein
MDAKTRKGNSENEFPFFLCALRGLCGNEVWLSADGLNAECFNSRLQRLEWGIR